MKLRWHQRRKIITAAMVKDYADKYGISLMKAKEELGSSNTALVLQYRTWYGRWQDVPHITEYYE